MTTEWEDYESAPLDFVKQELTTAFKEFKEEQTSGTMARMNEQDMERIVDKVMNKARKKYPKHLLPQEPIHKEQFKLTA